MLTKHSFSFFVFRCNEDLTKMLRVYCKLDILNRRNYVDHLSVLSRRKPGTIALSLGEEKGNLAPHSSAKTKPGKMFKNPP